MEAEKEQSSADKGADAQRDSNEYTKLTDNQQGKTYKIMLGIYFTDNIWLITNAGHFSRWLIIPTIHSKTVFYPLSYDARKTLKNVFHLCMGRYSALLPV